MKTASILSHTAIFLSGVFITTLLSLTNNIAYHDVSVSNNFQTTLAGTRGGEDEVATASHKTTTNLSTLDEVERRRKPVVVPRTGAKINLQLIADIFKGIDPFSSNTAFETSADWSYPHTHWQPAFFEHLWTKYVGPNHSDMLEFYLEVGSFKAGSITRLAETLKKSYPKWNTTSLVCMDPFTGDVNMWDWNRNSNKGEHNFLATGADGRPRIFETFMANVADLGHEDMILPIVVGGLVGMKLLARMKERGRIDKLPDIIYLDSAHEKDETYLELTQAWTILRECGAIIGDDWNWRKVRGDVVKFAKEKKLPTLPLYDAPDIVTQQPVSGLLVGPNNQWFVIKNTSGGCNYRKDGSWKNMLHQQ